MILDRQLFLFLLLPENLMDVSIFYQLCISTQGIHLALFQFVAAFVVWRMLYDFLLFLFLWQILCNKTSWNLDINSLLPVSSAADTGQEIFVYVYQAWDIMSLGEFATHLKQRFLELHEKGTSWNSLGVANLGCLHSYTSIRINKLQNAIQTKLSKWKYWLYCEMQRLMMILTRNSGLSNETDRLKKKANIWHSISLINGESS